MLRLPSGKNVAPAAAEIVAAEFGEQLQISGEQVSQRPSEALPAISFSKYPADISIQVTPPSADLKSAPHCQLLISVDSRPIRQIHALQDDQLLEGTDWFPLAPVSIEAISQTLRSVGIAHSGEITLRQYLDLRRLDPELVTYSTTAADAPAGPDSEPDTLPHGLNATLYPYQVTGFRWLTRVADEGLGCILGDQMGLGKTLQIISLVVRETRDGRSPCLVVAPATLLENWRREFGKFAPAIAVTLHQGRERTGFPAELRSCDVVVVSYDTAVRDISLLEMIGWNIVVLDEAQAIKTPDAQRTVAIKSVPRRVAIAVSGTPVENRLRDLWSLMDFAVPGLLGQLQDFESRYADHEDDAADLEPLVSPLILRRLVADVARDLPERIDIPQPVRLTDDAAARYDGVRQDIISEYGNSATLVTLIKLRMFCAHPFLIDDSKGDPLPASSKYARLLEILDEVFASGEKVLIFTSFQKMADILASDLRRRFRVPVSIIDGRTPVTERQPIIDLFSRTTASAALVLNPKAAGVGLNITAANHVIHYNLEWNPAVEDQATARAYRRGQTRPVTVHRLFHPGTVEEIINQRLLRKRALASNAVVGTEGDEDDLGDILRSLELSPLVGGNAYGG